MNRAHAGAVVVTLSLLALAAAVGATAAADGTDTVRQAQEANDSATPDGWFLHDAVTVEQGSTAAINVNLEHTDNATVVVGSNASTHRIVAAVTDGNGDGTVGLQFDTGGVGPQRIRFSTFHEADSVEVRSRTGHTGVLPATGYSLQLYLGGTAGEPTNASILHVRADGTPTTTLPPATDEPTADEPTTATPGSTDATTTGGQPGFGPAVAVAGLLAAALLAARR